MFSVRSLVFDVFFTEGCDLHFVSAPNECFAHQQNGARHASGARIEILHQLENLHSLDYETRRAREVGVIRRQRLQRSRGHAPVQLMRFAKSFVHQRFCADHRIIRDRAAAEQHTVRSDEAIIADGDRRRCLPIHLQIDRVREHLRLESGKGGELPDDDAVGAIDQVPMRDCRMRADNQFRAAIGFIREMRRRAERKTGDPISPADNHVFAELKQGDVLAQGEMANAGIGFHDQPFWKNPGEPDSSSRMNAETKLLLEKRATHAPWQQKTEKSDKVFHSCGASAR